MPDDKTTPSDEQPYGPYEAEYLGGPASEPLQPEAQPAAETTGPKLVPLPPQPAPQAQPQQQPQQQAQPRRAQLEFTFSRYFLQWLANENISIAVTTYQTGHLMFIGRQANGQISAIGRGFSRAMGLYVQPNTQCLYMSTVNTLMQFQNVLVQGEKLNNFDRVYVPRIGYVTGDLDIHDIVVDRHGRIVFVNTLHSCLATVSDRQSFKPLWKPPFISKLAPEDRCHLNGMAMRDGEPRYVTTISRSDAPGGWRDRRWEGGMVIDISTNEIVTTKLSMPHSPRYYAGKLWVLNSGTGYFGWVDFETGDFVPVAFCPGYMRGLTFHRNYAIIGLSLPRSKAFSELSLDANLKQKDVDPKCGFVVVDLQTGNIPHWFYFNKGVTELYDVAVLPGTRNPTALDFNSPDVNQLITIEKPDSPLDGPYRAQGGPVQVAGERRQQVQMQYRYQLSQDMTMEALTGDFAPLTFPDPADRETNLREPLVAVVAGTNEGYVGMALVERQDDDSAEVVSLFVHPEHRRRGVAKTLFHHIENALREMEAVGVFLRYDPELESTPALQRIARRRGYEEVEEDGAVVMQKSLR
jgi:uncharacterized protein (TIGR03032 family)